MNTENKIENPKVEEKKQESKVVYVKPAPKQEAPTQFVMVKIQ